MFFLWMVYVNIIYLGLISDTTTVETKNFIGVELETAITPEMVLLQEEALLADPYISSDDTLVISILTFSILFSFFHFFLLEVFYNLRVYFQKSRFN